MVNGKGICTATGCNDQSYIQGFCKRHYHQIRRHNKITNFGRSRKVPNDFIIEDGVGKIGCYNSKGDFTDYIIVDIEDLEKCKAHKWHITSYGYGLSRYAGRIHNFILDREPSRKVVVDHINRNKLDNRRSNLRVCTALDNCCNTNMSTRNTSGYRGVMRSNNGKRWVAEIVKQGKKIRIGTYGTKREAAIAYNKVAVQLNGEFAQLNKVIMRRSS